MYAALGFLWEAGSVSKINNTTNKNPLVREREVLSVVL